MRLAPSQADGAQQLHRGLHLVGQDAHQHGVRVGASGTGAGGKSVVGNQRTRGVERSLWQFTILLLVLFVVFAIVAFVAA